MANATRAIIALGSNRQAARTMRQAKGLLAGLLPGIVFSPMRQTAPIGITSASFVNCLGMTETTLPLENLRAMLKQIEAACGDTAADRSHNIVRMDIDILLYGQERLHQQDWERPYVQELLLHLHAST